MLNPSEDSIHRKGSDYGGSGVAVMVVEVDVVELAGGFGVSSDRGGNGGAGSGGFCPPQPPLQLAFT